MKTLFFTAALCLSIAWAAQSQCTVNIPYIEDFEEIAPPNLPPCMFSEMETFVGNHWRGAAKPIGDTPNYVAEYPTYSADDLSMAASLIGPRIPLQAGIPYKLSFKYGLSSPVDGIAYFNVSLMPWTNNISTINPVELTNVTETEGIFVSQQPIIADGTSLFSISFFVDTPANQGNFYIDDIIFEEWDCYAPDGLAVNGITETGATLSWTGNNAPNYEYVIVPAGEKPEFGISNTSLSVNVNDLQPGTAYTAYIRGFCMDSWSRWSAGVNFTTAGTPLGLSGHELTTVKLYPNPVKDVVTLSGHDTIDTVEIYNAIGQLVHRETVNAAEAHISLQHMAAGAYLLLVHSDSKVNKIKFLKE